MFLQGARVDLQEYKLRRPYRHNNKFAHAPSEAKGQKPVALEPELSSGAEFGAHSEPKCAATVFSCFTPSRHHPRAPRPAPAEAAAPCRKEFCGAIW